jgi:GAF domain-containing protein
MTEGADMEAGHAGEGVQADAAATIARQQAEIERLQRRVTEDRFAQDLRDALAMASATSTIGAPVSYTRLLSMIVATAADIIDANAALLFLTDARRQNLVFKVALGGRTVEAADFRVPLGHGVAGLVAQTGHPMAISDMDEDDPDVTEIAEAVDYVPKNILCVPLSFQDRVIGVLELLDREDGGTFTVADMEAMGLFANLAAVAIEQSRTESRMDALVVDLVQAVDGISDYDRQGMTERARAFTAELGQHSGYLDALELARLVQEIVHHGDAATRACRDILSGFVRFLRSRPMTAGELGGISW